MICVCTQMWSWVFPKHCNRSGIPPAKGSFTFDYFTMNYKTWKFKKKKLCSQNVYWNLKKKKCIYRSSIMLFTLYNTSSYCTSFFVKEGKCKPCLCICEIFSVLALNLFIDCSANEMWNVWLIPNLHKYRCACKYNLSHFWKLLSQTFLFSYSHTGSRCWHAPTTPFIVIILCTPTQRYHLTQGSVATQA